MTPWSHTVGFIPHKVKVFERVERKMVLYLIWRDHHIGNWAYKSLRRKLRNSKGNIDRDTRTWAIRQAAEKNHELVLQAHGASKPLELEVESGALFTVAEGLRRVVDPERGKYLVESSNSKEVVRALQFAIAEWGSDKRWSEVETADIRALWRSRIRNLLREGHRGQRGAEVTVTRLLSTAAWLRSEKLIPVTACLAPAKWKEDLAVDWEQITGSDREYKPKRPRHTLEEMRKILDASRFIDPRFKLLLALGAELRLGQVAKARRSDLNCKAGTFEVPGKRKKGGAKIELTGGQARAVDEALRGYLSDLEATGENYQLFPQGQLPGGRSGAPRAAKRHRNVKPIDRRSILRWFRRAEARAGIKHVKGRAAYGIRRVAVDEAKTRGASRDAVKAGGGWKDMQVPDKLYTDPELGVAEAREIRASIRGEKGAKRSQNVAKTGMGKTGGGAK